MTGHKGLLLVRDGCESRILGGERGKTARGIRLKEKRECTYVGEIACFGCFPWERFLEFEEGVRDLRGSVLVLGLLSRETLVGKKKDDDDV